MWPFCRVYSLCQWAVVTFRTRGASARPGHAGAQETLRPGAVACQGTKFEGLKAPFVAKFGVHLGKKSPMSHVGVCGVSEKKKKEARVREEPHAWGRGGSTRVETPPSRNIFDGFPQYSGYPL